MQEKFSWEHTPAPSHSQIKTELSIAIAMVYPVCCVPQSLVTLFFIAL